MKKCTGCNKLLPDTEFTGGRTGKCNTCNVQRIGFWASVVAKVKSWF